MRKICKRKHWATKGFDAIAHAIAGVMPTPQAEIDALHIRELSALEAMTHGSAGLQEWYDLSAALSMCEAAISMSIGVEAQDACKRAQDALLCAARRFEASGRMGLTGEGLQALRDVLEYHHLQRTSIDRATYERVIRKATDRQRTGVGVCV